MVHFNKKSITLDYLAIFQLFLIILKLTNRIELNWIEVFLPYIVATLMSVGGLVIVAIIATFVDED